MICVEIPVMVYKTKEDSLKAKEQEDLGIHSEIDRSSEITSLMIPNTSFIRIYDSFEEGKSELWIGDDFFLVDIGREALFLLFKDELKRG